MLKTKHLSLWTSDLEYSENIEKVIEIAIKDLSGKIIFHNDTKTTEFVDIDIDNLPWIASDPDQYSHDGKILDFTCIAKGYFIKYVIDHLPDPNIEYLISFGGDMAFNFKDEYFIPCAYNNFLFSSNFCKTLFCSTNIERPGHISNAKFNYSITVADNPILGDLIATKALTGELSDHAFNFDFHNKLLGKTYIASPFFNDTDIMIRDKMLEGFANYIRPDLLNPNIEGDLHKDIELAKKIREDNLKAIDECNFLVFPKNTTDLGTLFEIGYAIRRSKTIIRFDYEENKYEVVHSLIPNYVDPNKVYTLDLNKLGAGIILGYYHDYPDRFRYYLGSSRDNIMLMNNEEVKTPYELYPCYLENILSSTVYRLNTLTSGS